MDPSELDHRGFATVPDLVDGRERTKLANELTALLGASPGERDGFRAASVRALARSPAVRTVIEAVLGSGAFAYRATLFDKTPTANWLVAWHQDLVIPVRERNDAPGFGPWSNKHGTWFVQPPASVLAASLALRVDLDGSNETNGALRVLPGTHHEGVLSAQRIADLAATVAAVPCHVPAGGALLVRPLLLHASSKATQPAHRRIVHLEFTAAPLPAPLAFRCTY